jgi:hypothetical protein
MENTAAAGAAMIPAGRCLDCHTEEVASMLWSRTSIGALLGAFVMSHAAVGYAPGRGTTEAVDGADGPSAETRKERLSNKASDEQRVDNCEVPPECRGPDPPRRLRA